MFAKASDKPTGKSSPVKNFLGQACKLIERRKQTENSSEEPGVQELESSKAFSLRFLYPTTVLNFCEIIHNARGQALQIGNRTAFHLSELDHTDSQLQQNKNLLSEVVGFSFMGIVQSNTTNTGLYGKKTNICLKDYFFSRDSSYKRNYNPELFTKAEYEYGENHMTFKINDETKVEVTKASSKQFLDLSSVQPNMTVLVQANPTQFKSQWYFPIKRIVILDDERIRDMEAHRLMMSILDIRGISLDKLDKVEHDNVANRVAESLESYILDYIKICENQNTARKPICTHGGALTHIVQETGLQPRSEAYITAISKLVDDKVITLEGKEKPIDSKAEFTTFGYFPIKI
jgi:hypothetical protein